MDLLSTSDALSVTLQYRCVTDTWMQEDELIKSTGDATLWKANQATQNGGPRKRVLQGEITVGKDLMPSFTYPALQIGVNLRPLRFLPTCLTSFELGTVLFQGLYARHGS